MLVGPSTLLEPTGSGLLSGLEFVVKQVLDVAGQVTGAGNLALAAERLPAQRSNPAVDVLLAAGATCVGTSHTDQFAFSLAGVDSQTGQPRNPVDPNRLPGGSSSGSAVAVASGLVPIALATDTGGSIRVPASYCGLVGLRPTHGAVSTAGTFALAPSFDTVGWLARSAVDAARVGEVLLPASGREIRRLVLVEDALRLVAAEVAEATRAAARDLAGRLGLKIEVAPGLDLSQWAETFRTIQMAEVHAAHGDWVSAHPGAVGPAVAARFAVAATISAEQLAAARVTRRRLVEEADMDEDTAWLLPSAHGPAPLLAEWCGTRPDEVRTVTMKLTCIAGLLGAPALSLPLSSVDGLPVGLCLVGRPCSDRALLQLALRDEDLRTRIF